MKNSVRKIYKYMPFRDNFFDNFYIRCSQKSALNDPFEMFPDLHTLCKIVSNRKMPNIGVTDEQVRNTLIRSPHDRLIQTQSMFTDMGVMSFTKRFDNLLMWTHYGDDGKGLVIELDASHDFFNPKEIIKSEISDIFDLITPDHPKESGLLDVHYSERRGESFKNKESISMDDVYLEKSENWKYEEEVRLFRHLSGADFAFSKDRNLVDFYEKIKSNYIKNKTGNDKWEISPQSGSISLFYTSPENYYFYAIPTDAIISIICGPKMAKEHKEFIAIECRNKNIKFIESYIDPQEYKLNFHQAE